MVPGLGWCLGWAASMRSPVGQIGYIARQSINLSMQIDSLTRSYSTVLCEDA